MINVRHESTPETPPVKEQNKIAPDLVVDFVRHGAAKYTQEEYISGQLQGELTEDGKKQIEAAAESLADGIDKDKEIVWIWHSPKTRAKLSAGIVERIFRDKGIEIFKAKGTSGAIPVLKDTRMSKDFIAADWGDWMNEWVEREDALPLDMEKPEDVDRRIGVALNALGAISRKVQPGLNKSLRVICITHEEGFRGLLEAGFSKGTTKGTGPKNAEIMEIGIFNTEQNQKPEFKISYRGESATLELDKRTKKLNKTSSDQEDLK